MPPASAVLPQALHVPHASDRTLVARVADGDPAAFEELYRRHSRAVLQQARKLCSGRELAEEVAQETFISLWRSAHSYRPALGSVGAWLSTMVRNRAIDAWRRTASRPVEVASSDYGSDRFHGAADAHASSPDRAYVLGLLANLPAAQKQAVFLAYFGDMTHSEIATCVDAPLGTIKGRIRLGLEKIGSEVERQRDVCGALPYCRNAYVPSTT